MTVSYDALFHTPPRHPRTRPGPADDVRLGPDGGIPGAYGAGAAFAAGFDAGDFRHCPGLQQRGHAPAPGRSDSRAVLREIAKPYELVLVNDGSRDRSWGVIEGICRDHAWVRGIDLMRNQGQENALLCGIRAAAFDTAVVMDDDLQNPPEEIPRLLAKLGEGFDVAYGTPQREQHGLLARPGVGGDKAGAPECDGGRQRPERDGVQGVPHAAARRLRRLRQPLRVAGRAAELGDAAVRGRQGPPRPADGRPVQLHLPEAGDATPSTWRPASASSRSSSPASWASSSPLAGFGVLCLRAGGLLPPRRPGARLPLPGRARSRCSPGAQMFALGIIGEYLARPPPPHGPPALRRTPRDPPAVVTPVMGATQEMGAGYSPWAAPVVATGPAGPVAFRHHYPFPPPGNRESAFDAADGNARRTRPSSAA